MSQSPLVAPLGVAVTLLVTFAGCSGPAEESCISTVPLEVVLEAFDDPIGDAMLRGGSLPHSHASDCANDSHLHDPTIHPVDAVLSRGVVAVGEYQELRLLVGTKLLRVQAEILVLNATTISIRNETHPQLFVNGNKTAIQAIEWLRSPAALGETLINENLRVPFNEVVIPIPVNSTWNQGLVSGFVLYHSLDDPHRKGDAGFEVSITFTNPDGVLFFSRNMTKLGDHGELTMRPLTPGIWTLSISTDATSNDVGIVSFAGAFRY